MSGSPVPLSQIVLKVHSRCDLACDHCYVYEAADQSWRGRPTVISDEVISHAARRIADHVSSHALPAVQVVLHGGEPLLAGPARLRRVITELRKALGGLCDLGLRIHTNGVLLSAEYCKLFAEHEVKVGISIDGDRAANDRHRRTPDGRSSYDKVIRAIGLLRTGPFRHLYAGLLCTIDTANDPLAVYESLMDLRPPRIDFLLPHATWAIPRRQRAMDSEYADWLSRSSTDGSRADARPGSGPSIRSSPPCGAAQATPKPWVSTRSACWSSRPTAATSRWTRSKQRSMGLRKLGRTCSATPSTSSPRTRASWPGSRGGRLCQTCQECPVVSSCAAGCAAPHRTGAGFAIPPFTARTCST